MTESREIMVSAERAEDVLRASLAQIVDSGAQDGEMRREGVLAGLDR